MCDQIYGQPYRIVLERERTERGDIIETFTYALGKLTNFRSDMHVSRKFFTYPIGKRVSDPNAILGNHTHSLHFLPNVECDPGRNGYGSHEAIPKSVM
jgi:hypothetical protein